MNHRSEKIVEYAQALDAQIEALQHENCTVRGELSISQQVRFALQKRIEELELTASDGEVKS